jgi:molybdate transport system substrate-binding protein
MKLSTLAHPIGARSGCVSGLASCRQRADEVKVFSSVAMRAVVEELAQRFERDTKHHGRADFRARPAQLKSRIEGGEAYDLAILTPAQIDDLIKQGKAAAASRAVIARTGLGLMVRAGRRSSTSPPSTRSSAPCSGQSR